MLGRTGRGYGLLRRSGASLQRMVVASVVLPSMKNTISYITVFEGSNVEGDNYAEDKDDIKTSDFSAS